MNIILRFTVVWLVVFAHSATTLEYLERISKYLEFLFFFQT